MPLYAVAAMQMVATGSVEQMFEWREEAGRRVPSEIPVRDPETGLPVFEVQVLYACEQWGRVSSALSPVRVPLGDSPNLAPLTPVVFEGLQVQVSVSKTGTLRERWSARGITASAPQGGRAARE